MNKRNINYRKNIVRELHMLKHRKKYLYQTLYHSTLKRYPDGYEWLDSLKREYEIVQEKIELLENICGGNNMSEFRALDGGKPFIQPEDPFLLITEDIDGNVSYCWWDDEEKMQEDAIERRGYGERIVVAIEIASCRDVDIPHEYTVDDFIEEVNSAYDEAKQKGFDSIVLAIDTDDETYYIHDTGDGFQCDEFDYTWEDLDSIAAALYDEGLIGKPVEIRIE